MPSATRAEALVGIPEVIDGPHALEPSESAAQSGPALKARRHALARFPPLGPPDMLYVRKRYLPVVGLQKTYGYYHFVRGVEPGSVAKISAYIVDVLRNTGLDPSGWVATGAWEIASATFVSYNFITRADVTVHVDFPGGTTAEAVDRFGDACQLTELFWSQLLVSSTLRDMLSHGEQPLYPCLRVVVSPSPTASEAAFLDAAARCVHTWHLGGSSTPERPAASPSSSHVALAIRDHLISHARYETAITFFSDERVTAADPLNALHSAATARVAGDLSHAESIVDALLLQYPEAPLAWMERANILRAHGQLEKALDAAGVSAAHSSDDVYIWTLLADLHVDNKAYEKAFDALNSADMPPPPLDPYLRELVPNRNNKTLPVEGASRGTDAVRVLAERAKFERNLTNSSTDEILTELPAKRMEDTDHACYAVLVKIMNDLSWDSMLTVRGQCFVMEADINSGDVDREALNEEGYDDNLDGLDPEPNSDTSNHNEATNGVRNISLEDGNDDGTNGDAPSNPEANGQHSENQQQNGGSLSPTSVDDRTALRKRSLEKTGKKVCKPWLDYLVTSMYHDLRAMALWNAEEEQFREALAPAALSKRAHSEGGEDRPGRSVDEQSELEAQEAEEPFQRTASEIVETNRRPSADWLRRGLLAMRLGKREEARTAFWVCVKVAEKEKTVSVTALTRLMMLASEDGDMRTTIKCADGVWTYADRATDRKSSSEPTAPIAAVRKAMFYLISKKGLRAVREAVTSQADVARKRMESLLLDSVALRVDGFSR